MVVNDSVIRERLCEELVVQLHDREIYLQKKGPGFHDSHFKQTNNVSG